MEHFQRSFKSETLGIYSDFAPHIFGTIVKSAVRQTGLSKRYFRSPELIRRRWIFLKKKSIDVIFFWIFNEIQSDFWNENFSRVVQTAFCYNNILTKIGQRYIIFWSFSVVGRKDSRDLRKKIEMVVIIDFYVSNWLVWGSFYKHFYTLSRIFEK